MLRWVGGGVTYCESHPQSEMFLWPCNFPDHTLPALCRDIRADISEFKHHQVPAMYLMLLQVPAACQWHGPSALVAVPGQHSAAAGDWRAAHHAIAAGHYGVAAGGLALLIQSTQCAFRQQWHAAMSNLPAGQHGADGWSSCRSQLQKQPSAAVVKPDAAAAAGALLQVSMVVTAVLSYCLVHLLLLFMCAEVRFAQVSQRPHARADACPAAEVGQCGHRERGYAACRGQAAVPRAGPAAAAVPCGAEANSAAGRGAVAAMPTQGQPHQQLSAL